MLRKLRESYTYLTPEEVVRKIADRRIAGNWVREGDIKMARELSEKNMTEEEASKFLDKLDDNRMARYGFYRLFD